jgi:ribosomal protein S27E
MADIEITCPQCATVTTVSEFADDTNLQCRSCGARIEKPGGLAAAAQQKETEATFSVPPPTQSSLRLAKRKREYTAPAEGSDDVLKAIVDTPTDNGPASQGQDGPLELRPEVKPDTRRVSHAAIAGALFLVLGGGMGYLRYGGGLRPDYLALSAEYGWIAVLAFHVIVVLKAMTDSMMQGILCLLVPGYSLFYIFAVSDDFYLRAVFGGLLVGLGQDAAVKLNMYASQMANVAHDFIQRGGGDIR